MRGSIIVPLIAAALYSSQVNALVSENVAMSDLIQPIDGVQVGLQRLGSGGKRILRTERNSEGNTEERVNWKGLFFVDEAAAKVAKEAHERKRITELAPRFKQWNQNGNEALDVARRFTSEGWSIKKATKMADRYAEYLKNPSLYQ
ncbi:RxLR effector protein [Phytophthora megakarya]|uniref:RxLR effector protein n=1 Tax=Phytophthora megakarya TaxID=4795 RepID=A0A225W7P6_9STRA|nr:RxLR effector protein [Phytophthora megakarya]